jgi:hypothetical protein
MQSTMSSEPSGEQLIAHFLRQVSELALDLADELDSMGAPDHTHKSLDRARLGSLQLSVAKAAGMDTSEGASPREITRHLGRSDEPNVRTALAAMAKHGVTELVPGDGPQRWRLTAPYRTEVGS